MFGMFWLLNLAVKSEEVTFYKICFRSNLVHYHFSYIDPIFKRRVLVNNWPFERYSSPNRFQYEFYYENNPIEKAAHHFLFNIKRTENETCRIFTLDDVPEQYRVQGVFL